MVKRINSFIWKKSFGFTLAETLITIAIIGIVAVITLPNLIQKYNEVVTVKKVQKAYSVLNQAYLSAVEEYGVPSSWDIPLVPSISNAIIARNKLFFKFPARNDCDTKDSLSKCGIAKVYKRLHNLGDSAFPSENAVATSLNDGSSFYVFVNNKSYSNRANTLALSNTLGFVNVDINGINPPNTLGKDYFLFYITDYGIIPCGTKDEIKYVRNNTALKQIQCSPKTGHGRGGAAWVLSQKNMKYLHSEKCSWSNLSCQ